MSTLRALCHLADHTYPAFLLIQLGCGCLALWTTGEEEGHIATEFLREKMLDQVKYVCIYVYVQ